MSQYFTRDLRLKNTAYNVLWAGARGDDSTDNLNALNRAADKVGQAGGGQIFVPDGIYQISDTWKIKYDYVTVIGETVGQPFTFGASTGGSVIKAKTSFAASHIIQVAQDSPTRALVGNAIRNLSVSGFNATSSNGIYWMVINGDIQRCFLAGMDCGIYTEGNAFGGDDAPYDCFFDDVKIQSTVGNGISFFNWSSDFRLTNVIVSDAGGDGIYFDATANHVAGPGTQMLGCYIYSCAGKAVYAQSPWQMEFVGNRFMDCNGGIYMDTVPVNFGGAGFKIVGNVFRNLSVTTDNTTDAININPDHVCRGGIITGNSFYTDAGLDNSSYNRMRYGINVASANMENLYIGPMSQGYVTAATSCFGTAPISDSGTNTQICGGLNSGLVPYHSTLRTYGKTYPAQDTGALQTSCGIYAGTGAPNNSNGSNGDYYFRGDGGAGTQIYFKSAGAWAGIL